MFPLEWEVVKSRLMTLLESGKHSQLRGALMMLNNVDIAQFLEELDPDKLLLVFRILPKDISADVFSYMSAESRQTLINSIGDNEIRSLINDMFLDDAVDFLEELPAGVVKRVLQNTDPGTRNLINQFLRYPENSAGSIMTIEYMEVHASMTVDETMALIRRVGLDKETIYTIYVIDEQRKLLGTIPLRKLILADGSARAGDLMETGVASVTTTDDQEKVAEVVRHYDLMAIPVVDQEGRLVGIVTADDIMDVIEAENTEDFEKMAALTPSDDEYLKTPVLRMAVNRIPWLILLAVIAIFTGMIISNYEDLLSASGHIGIVLTACIPMLMDTGGNCGAQSSTLIIRGLSLGEIQLRDFFKALWKEFRVALLVGAVLFVFTMLRVRYINNADWTVAFVVAISLYCTIILAKALGCAMPMLAKRLGMDPALMASPLITTIVDMASLTIYFSVATALLPI